MRLDRLLSIGLFAPLSRFTFPRKRKKIPILMYHSISNDGESGVHPYYSIGTTPEIFTQQMQSLSENGYRAVDIGTALEMLHSNSTGKNKAVVLTFDDGYMDFFREAVPVLRRFGYTATVYLPTSWIHDRISQRFNGKECLTWDKVRELNDAGYVFGSHSATHGMLRNMKRKEIEDEICLSKAVIEDKIGRSVESFSYPYAFPEENRAFRKDLRQLLEGACYRNGVSTTIGRISGWDDPYFLRRLPVNSFDDADLFRAKLEGGYDWMSKPQYGFKVIKRMLG